MTIIAICIDVCAATLVVHFLLSLAVVLHENHQERRKYNAELREYDERRTTQHHHNGNNW